MADGEVFPFDRDKGRMIVPHERLDLTDAQQHEAVARHRITLTSAQHERLTTTCPTFPKTIKEILPYNWGDCTCLVGHPYAILLPGDVSVAIPREEFGWVTRYGVCPSSMPKRRHVSRAFSPQPSSVQNPGLVAWAMELPDLWPDDLHLSEMRPPYRAGMDKSGGCARRDVMQPVGHPSSDTVRYRPNVAGIVRRADGCVLIGERSDVAGAWQFPQGGIDAGETAWEALVRELEEEVGLMPGEYLAGPVSGPHRYDFPNGRLRGEFGGQEQTWFLVELKEDGVGITHETADREFRALKWIVPGDFRLGWLVPMKHEVYRVVMWEFFGVELRE